MATKPKRRWSRYSLRTLLVFMTVASAGLGWLGIKVQQAQRQKEAVEAIKKLGGYVFYDYEIVGDDPIKKFDPDKTPPGPGWLSKVVGKDLFANVVSVNCPHSRVTDADLVHLQSLKHCNQLSLFNAARITDVGLVHLRTLTELEHLDLTNAEVTDAGLEHLQGLMHLKTLSLNSDQVTNVGLLHLRTCPELNWLQLYGTRVTDKGCQELQKALPNLQIFR
jgi:hypothetical protein